MAIDTPTMSRNSSDPDSLHLKSSSDTTYTDEKLVIPNPAISVISAVGRHAKRTCKQLANFHGRHHEKPPNMAKMRIVTPVYDPVLEKWVWPDSVRVDEDDDQIEEHRRREKRRSVDRGSDARSGSRSALFVSSRTTSSGRSSSR